MSAEGIDWNERASLSESDRRNMIKYELNEQEIYRFNRLLKSEKNIPKQLQSNLIEAFTKDGYSAEVLNRTYAAWVKMSEK